MVRKTILFDSTTRYSLGSDSSSQDPLFDWHQDGNRYDDWSNWYRYYRDGYSEWSWNAWPCPRGARYRNWYDWRQKRITRWANPATRALRSTRVCLTGWKLKPEIAPSYARHEPSPSCSWVGNCIAGILAPFCAIFGAGNTRRCIGIFSIRSRRIGKLGWIIFHVLIQINSPGFCNQ